MGYLSQRKKQARIRFMLKTLIVLLGIFSLVAFGDGRVSEFLNKWRFQFYLLGFLGMIYALKVRFWWSSVCLFVIWFVNFLVISSYVPIVFSDEDTNSPHKFSIAYQSNSQSFFDITSFVKQNPVDVLALLNPQFDSSASFKSSRDYVAVGNTGGKNSFLVSRFLPQTSGKIQFAPNNSAIFMKISVQEQEIVLIMLDWSNLTSAQIQSALSTLNKIVSSQDNPVIICGDFAMTAWSTKMSRFLKDNGLEVKNSLLSLTENIVLSPTQYVVGYAKLTCEGAGRVSADGQDSSSVLFKLKI